VPSGLSSTPPPTMRIKKKSSPYPLDRRLGGPHFLSGRFGEEKNLI
jgi:hypothetical protein